MARYVSCSVLAFGLLALVGVADDTTAPDKAGPGKVTATKTTAEPPRVQMAILLDTSGSMRGLIDQARSQLWNIVNEFATTKRDGQRPQFSLALYQYGSGNLPAEDGYMRQVLPLTDDLDRVSEELFRLTAGGSKEYCGQVIERAAQELEWSSSSNDLKCIFIAGNEGFGQGPVDFRAACRKAIERGATVSTIYCGPRGEGLSGMWGEGAMLADGTFTAIDHNSEVAIASPQDDELVKLSAALNKTYVAYGTAKARETNSKRQWAQDANAAAASLQSAAQRAVCKAGVLYCPSDWDLIDGCRTGKIKLADLKEDQLPEFMRKMTLKERQAHIDKLAADRKGIQDKIKVLSAAREKHVAAEMQKLREAGQKVLDDAILESARSQAAKKGFRSN